MEPVDDVQWDGPSKSMRKREAQALQKLGERLIGLRDEHLRGLPLPETLLDAILEARRLKSLPALARQRQYIGKLMRDIDVEPLQQALDAILDTHNAQARRRK